MTTSAVKTKSSVVTQPVTTKAATPNAAPTTEQIAKGAYIQEGDAGDTVTYAKEQLVASGDLTEADAKKSKTFDATSVAALKKFQAKTTSLDAKGKKLAVDGLAGPKTFAAFERAAKARAAEATAQEKAKSTFEPSSLSVKDLAASTVDDVAKVKVDNPDKLDVKTVAQYADGLVKGADGKITRGTADGKASAAELGLLKEYAQAELKKGDASTAANAGSIAGVAAQLEAAQTKTEAASETGALAEAIDTSSTTSGKAKGDGKITRTEIEAYAAKQRANGKTDLAEKAEKLLTLLPAEMAEVDISKLDKFKKYDTNSNGKLDSAELKAAQATFYAAQTAALTKLAANSDLTAAEKTALENEATFAKQMATTFGQLAGQMDEIDRLKKSKTKPSTDDDYPDTSTVG